MSVAPYLLFEGGRNGSGFEYWVVSGRRDNHVAADGCWCGSGLPVGGLRCFGSSARL